MLWTDAKFISVADLLRVDSESSEVAAAESNPIDIDGGIIPLAIEECGTELYVQLQRFGGLLSNGQLSSAHLQAVFNTGSSGVNRTRILLSQIVVDGTNINVVKAWVTYKALRLLYRDCFARTKADRFVKKMEQYEKDIRGRYWPNIMAMGLPIVEKPLSCPGAILERSGTWDNNNVSTGSAPGALASTYFVVITYVDNSQYLGSQYGNGPGAANNGESYQSAAIQQAVLADTALKVDINSLYPPNGQPDSAQQALSVSYPLKATGWNVYVGATATGPFFLQNTTPIPIGTKTYSLASDPVLSGPRPNPQFVELFITLQDSMQRG